MIKDLFINQSRIILLRSFYDEYYLFKHNNKIKKLKNYLS